MARGLYLLGLVALGAATTIASERPSRAADPIPIKFVMDWAWEGTQASWAVASDSGCYAKAGLDVKTDRGFGSGDAIGKVVGGAYDIGVADLQNAEWNKAQAVRIDRYWSGDEAPAGRGPSFDRADELACFILVGLRN